MKIKLYHYRVPFWYTIRQKGPPPPMENLVRSHSACPIESRGGVTRAVILDDNDRVVAEGIARCSMGDNFCRKVGRDKAIGRAIQQLGEKEREEITKANPALRF